jgi:hypothetical protein
LRLARSLTGLLCECFSSNTIWTACTKAFPYFEITSVKEEREKRKEKREKRRKETSLVGA